MIIASKVDRAPWDQSIFRCLLLALLLISFGHAAYFLLVGINHPILDYYSFRQSQTAITAYWMWRDGFQLAYETPVLGYPWSIPFEFPLFQWLTALLRAIGVPIEVGGRLVAFGFFVATLYPLWILTKSLKLKTRTWWIVSILFLSSPLYVYWSRTVMIESCALFFGVYVLALIAQYLERPELRTLLLALVVGSLAVLTKATTFPAYAFLAGLLILAKGYTDLREGISAQKIRTLSLAAAALFIPLGIGFLWVWYTDQIRLENPFGGQLNAMLAQWNFGTWGQRVSTEFWRGAVLGRILPDLFGYGAFVGALAALAALLSRQYGTLMVAALIGFLLPFLLFTNLHLHHSYYQNANGLLALSAAGLGIAAIVQRGQLLIAGTILAAISIGQITYFRHHHYASMIGADLTKNPIYSIAQAVKSTVSPDQAILVLGQDWSSDIPYQSERKALALPNWFSMSLMVEALENPERFLGGKKLGGIVYCTTYGYNEKSALIQSFVAEHRVVADNGECKLLSTTR